MSTNNKTLWYLDELPDYKVASEDCDVRGWEVKDKDSRSIGKVDGLLVNKATERVVYLDVEVNKELIEKGHQTYAVPASNGVHGFLNKEGDDHLIIPIGMVELDEENEKVLATGLDMHTFAKASRFEKGASIDRDYEISLMRHYLPGTAIDYPSDIGDNFYDGKEFQNTLNRRKL